MTKKFVSVVQRHAGQKIKCIPRDGQYLKRMHKKFAQQNLHFTFLGLSEPDNLLSTGMQSKTLWDLGAELPVGEQTPLL